MSMLVDGTDEDTEGTLFHLSATLFRDELTRWVNSEEMISSGASNVKI